MRQNRYVVLSLLGLISFSISAQGGVYRCDSDGKVIFSQLPCGASAKNIEPGMGSTFSLIPYVSRGATNSPSKHLADTVVVLPSAVVSPNVGPDNEANHIKAEVITGTVTSIIDGDTLDVLESTEDDMRRLVRIRLSGIDAPELGQLRGYDAAKALKEYALKSDVTILWYKKDMYGRVLGKVLYDGHDINLAMISAGWAWWYRDHADEQPATDRYKYKAAEASAKANRRGLWFDYDPTPPWLGRRYPHQP